MQFLFLVVTALVSGRLETSIKPSVVTWLIDGTNVQCCSGKGGKKEREEIIQELERIASPDVSTFATDQRIANVVLVFDGDLYETFDKVVLGPWFQIIITDGAGKRKDRADDYIINDALPELQNRFSFLEEKGQKHVIHLVTADKDLKRRAAKTQAMNGGSCIHPPKFWQKYLPNLKKVSSSQIRS